MSEVPKDFYEPLDEPEADSPYRSTVTTTPPQKRRFEEGEPGPNNPVPMGEKGLWRLFRLRSGLGPYYLNQECCVRRMFNDKNRVRYENGETILTIRMCDDCTRANLRMIDTYMANFTKDFEKLSLKKFGSK